MKQSFLLIICLIMIWSCAGTLPEWYNNREEYYPKDKYIVSKGWGETPEKAIEKAIINMAQIFNTRVTVEKNILQRYESISNMKDFDEYLYEFSEENARLISEQNLVNVSFVEPVYEKRSKSFYTLAYIQRSETGRILMDRMKREQESMEYYVRMAQSKHDPVSVFHYYTAAWLTAGRNKMMQEQLDILIPGVGIKPIYNFAELEVLKDKAAEYIRFKIFVEGDANGRIKQAFRTAVNNAGFTTVEQNAIIQISAKSLIKKIDIDQDPLAFVSWELQIKMNKDKNETALSMMEEGREGSTNIENAKMHAYENMQKYIENEFENKLLIYFDKLEQ
ncbi:MAG: hypothetical protein U9O95_00355 [Candidatus Marinimicrobia bacterium]|nr:hypothetical protein [Candidatus Neomarinimicrobiota bacterium]